MERDSIAYKVRREGQVLASYVLPHEMLSKIYCKAVTGEEINFRNPKTFNEKLQWLKLYYYPYEKKAIQCCDKYRVREYVRQKGLGNILVPIVGLWINANDIDWDSLPNQFVLKCNHGCAYNIVCNNKTNLDKDKTVNQLNKWLREDFGRFNLELHYSKIKERVITCEEFLGEKLTDYKFFCFNGNPKFLYVSNDLYHDRQAQIGFFNLDGSHIPLYRSDYAEIESIKFPKYFDEMLEDARVLSKDFPFVRVDFFVTKEKFYFAELTFVPAAGMMPFNPEAYNLKWGGYLDVDAIIKNHSRQRKGGIT